MITFADLTKIKGTNEPNWRMNLGGNFRFSTANCRRYNLGNEVADSSTFGFYYVADNFLDADECSALIEIFTKQETHPVGVDGYGDKAKPTAIGSWRANAWAPQLAETLTNQFKCMLKVDDKFTRIRGAHPPVYMSSSGEPVKIPLDHEKFHLIGSTPYLRFMRYPGGGKHVPHYDAPFISPQGEYLTLMSWVLYLNTPPGSGGEFQFIDDGQWNIHPIERDRSDWREMAPVSKVLASITPQCGRLLFFPHWLPHQVALYENKGPGWRMIIRGDVAYACE
jgi:hypothetical protein